MSRLKKYFTQRYPYEENKWKIIVPISLFIAIFLVIFQPFGLEGLQIDYKYYFLAGYGLVTFLVLVLVMILLPAVFPGSFREEKWTIIKEFSHLLLIIFCIGLANLLYSTWFIDFRLTLPTLLIFQGFTLAVGVIPITMLILIKQSYLNRKNMVAATQINTLLPEHQHASTPGHTLRITSDTGREEVVVSSSDLLFIKSEGNYITVGYLRNNRFHSSLLRNTMKYAEESLATLSGFFRCHRSWIVNLERISRVSGNSQGLRLSLPGLDEEIPVARNLVDDFRRRLRS
ncbi:MAG: LytTR family DNA-binding domain-containing protein [Bacteroidales bacterium]|jgi:DNA-binding LytR/AlgR family response regulator